MAKVINERAILLSIPKKNFNVDTFVQELINHGFCTKLESHNVRSDITTHSMYPKQFVCLGNKEYRTAVFPWTGSIEEFKRRPNNKVLSPNEIKKSHIDWLFQT
ncbi:MAG: hypothetical protein NTX91_01500 [candidate division SR1 bacterium]|nr:hypothetical protein [candidate division SR1 bacterium]